jgi:hypothetical protein
MEKPGMPSWIGWQNNLVFCDAKVKTGRSFLTLIFGIFQKKQYSLSN